MEEIKKLAALLQSGALDVKSLVVVPRWDLRIEVPQSFFRDVGLIEAVKEAEAGRFGDTERWLRSAADKIRSAVHDASQDVYESVIEGLPDEMRARQIDRYLNAHSRTTDPTEKGIAERLGRPLELPDPKKFLSNEVIQDLVDREVIETFEVVEVTGPAVVRLECGHYGPYWVIQSLREDLAQLMRQMESK